MSRCELHHGPGPTGHRPPCGEAAVLTVQTLVGFGLETCGEFLASACAEHAWEATARAALKVRELRSAGHDDARIIATIEPDGEHLLETLRRGITVGDRWPLAEPWVRR